MVSSTRRIQADHQFTPWYQLWRQPLAAVIRMPWPLVFIGMGLLDLVEVLLFAALFSLDGQHLIGSGAMGMPKPLAFSVDNFFSNGFSDIHADSLYNHLLAVSELVSGLITLSILTALVFRKLDRNATPLRFSRRLCVSHLDGGHLYCRFVTSDPSQWLNVRYSLSLLIDDEPEAGVVQRRLLALPLLNAGTPQLSQTATLIHPLTPDSPIRHLGLAELQRRNAVLMPLVEGIDECSGSSLLQTHTYRPADLELGYRFSDLVSSDANGQRHVNLQRLNHIEPCTP